MKDDIARKGADALLRGAKMLGYACPACKMPLYQFPSGEIRCINCDKEVKIVRSNEEAKQVMQLTQKKQENNVDPERKAQVQKQEEQDVHESIHEREQRNQWRMEKQELIRPSLRNMSKKLELLSKKLLEIDDSVEIMRITELMKGISEVMKVLEEI